MWYTMEYCSAIRKDEMLSFATTWMDLGDNMPNEVRQSETGEEPHDFAHIKTESDK